MHQVTPEELQAHLGEQMEFIKASSRSFDEGFLGEGKRLAATIRVLVHDTAQSKSLLGLLNVKQSLLFMDTAPRLNRANLAPTWGLPMMDVGNRTASRFFAPLGVLPPSRIHPPKLFDAWWSDPVTKDQEGREFCRKDFVMTVANKEGGAHIDPVLSPRWMALTRHNSLGVNYVLSEGNRREVEGDLALQSVRQIAYEIEQTIRTLL